MTRAGLRPLDGSGHQGRFLAVGAVVAPIRASEAALPAHARQQFQQCARRVFGAEEEILVRQGRLQYGQLQQLQQLAAFR